MASFNQFKVKYDVGYRDKNNNGQWYTIIKRISGTKKPRRQAKFVVRFDDTGYEAEVFGTAIRGGRVKDRYAKDIYGVACIGAVRKIDNVKEYDIWVAMIARCYNPDNKYYHNYGGNNVTVCDRWLCFENFLSDIKLVEGYDDYKFHNERIELDKDVKQRGLSHKVYSLDTCKFVTSKENNSRENRRNGMIKE